MEFSYGWPVAADNVDGNQMPNVNSALPADLAASNPLRCLLWCGTNDLAVGTGTATLEGYYGTWAATCAAAGVQQGILTIPPANNTVGGFIRTPGSAWDIKRIAVNNWLLAGNLGPDVTVFDVESVPELVDPTDTTFYPDGLHLSGSAKSILAAALAGAFTVPNAIPRRTTVDINVNASDFNGSIGTAPTLHAPPYVNTLTWVPGAFGGIYAGGGGWQGPDLGFGQPYFVANLTDFDLGVPLAGGGVAWYSGGGIAPQIVWNGRDSTLTIDAAGGVHWT
jgi:hypothetical protein